MLVGAILALGAGCTPKQSYAAKSNQRLTENEQNENFVLSQPEQLEALAAMVAVAEGHQAVHPPDVAPAGMRWSDVPAALRAACDEMEMAVVRWRQDPRAPPTEYDCSLKTIDDRPGRILIRRTTDDRVYVAEVTVGRFDGHANLESGLLDAFERAMRRFGAKRVVPRDGD